MRPRIFTDGSYSLRDDVGGWAWCTEKGEFALGRVIETTNNRMELLAALEAMRAHEGLKAVIVSDSQYLVNCMNDLWYEKWKRDGWRNSGGKPVANRDLWLEILKARKGFKFEWVRGHVGHPMNEQADKLAGMARKGLA